MTKLLIIVFPLQELSRELIRCQSNRIPVYAVLLFLSTSSPSLDRVDEVLRMRDDFAKAGLSFWVNAVVDADAAAARIIFAEGGRKYWATRSSVRSFARTTHSFAYSALLASLARTAALIRSLVHSLTHSRARGKVFD